MALRRVLVSPDFLFRRERDPEGAAPGAPYLVSEHELAARLSFFLWSSIPDDELLDLADRGALREPGVLEAQVERMLADPRAASLVDNFGGQWLYLRNMALVAPDPYAFADFDANLREAMAREMELFLDRQIRRDHGVLELLTSDETFVNQRLAEHYGIPGVYGNHFRPVALAGDLSPRRGLLGKGSLLTVTSYAHRTSPVVRGKWLLENILGSPPPPPPPDVPPSPRTTTAASPPARCASGSRCTARTRVRGLPPRHGPPRLRARELRRHRPLADADRGGDPGRCGRRARRRPPRWTGPSRWPRP